VFVNECVGCTSFPCDDVRHECYAIPAIDVDPDLVTVVLISEAAPDKASDYYYSGADALFAQTTVQAFKDAGTAVSSIQDIVGLGVYMTTAVKCSKTAYTIKPGTVDECSRILQQELALFPRAKAYLLMGDAAIRAVNTIAKRKGQPRVIPAGSTYKIRGQVYTFEGKRAFPSYVQAGPSFFIEKSKRRMIAEDIAAALQLASA
jgi:uracil-DNA glycosylase